MKESNLVAIGLRAKTAALSQSCWAARATHRGLEEIRDEAGRSKVPATAQPYHEVMDLPWEESEKAVRKSARAIEAIARKALAQLIKELQSAGMKVSGVGIVGAKDKDLARIGNFHIARMLPREFCFGACWISPRTRAAYAGEPFRTETLTVLLRSNSGRRVRPSRKS